MASFPNRRRMAMVKGAGDPFLLAQRRQRTKAAKKVSERIGRPPKLPNGTFRDPKVTELVDQK